MQPSIDMQDVSVETPQDSTYEGKKFDGKVWHCMFPQGANPPPPQALLHLYYLMQAYYYAM